MPPNASREQVSTHSRSKAAALSLPCFLLAGQCFNSQPLEGGCVNGGLSLPGFSVSTHSRSKAAAAKIGDKMFGRRFQLTAARRRLHDGHLDVVDVHRFQLTAARRRLRVIPSEVKMQVNVSTHSRSKAAAWGFAGRKQRVDVSTHSRSKAAASSKEVNDNLFAVSTHSRSKAAAKARNFHKAGLWFQLTAARRRLQEKSKLSSALQTFQLTAARRRLRKSLIPLALHSLFQLTAARRRLLSASKSAKNQLITNILSLTHSDVKEFGKYSARFCAIQSYK